MVDKEDIIFGLMIILPVVIMSILFLDNQYKSEEIKNLKQSALMWNFTTSDKYNSAILNGTGRVNGISYNDVFVIYAKDRDITSVLNDCAHEWAHIHEGMDDGRN